MQRAERVLRSRRGWEEEQREERRLREKEERRLEEEKGEKELEKDFHEKVFKLGGQVETLSTVLEIEPDTVKKLLREMERKGY